MYSAKEKLTHFHKLVSPTVVEADLTLLHEKAPHLTDFTRFDLAPEKNHEEILFLLLDHCEHDEIVRNRREYASQAADEDNNSSKDGDKDPKIPNANGDESPDANGGEGDEDPSTEEGGEKSPKEGSEDGDKNPEIPNANGDESPDANGGEGDEDPSTEEGGKKSSEEGSEDNEPTEPSSEEPTAPSEDKDDDSSKQEKAKETPKKKKKSTRK